LYPVLQAIPGRRFALILQFPSESGGGNLSDLIDATAGELEVIDACVPHEPATAEAGH